MKYIPGKLYVYENKLKNDSTVYRTVILCTEVSPPSEITGYQQARGVVIEQTDSYSAMVVGRYYHTWPNGDYILYDKNIKLV